MKYVAFAVIVYLVYAALGFMLQRRLLYPGVSMAPYRAIRTDTVPGVEQLWFENGEGRSEAWFVPASPAGRGTPAPAVIHLHGNAEFIDDWLDMSRPLTDLGLGVLLLEYPGYGRSTGKPSQTSIVATTEAAFDWLQGQSGVDGDRIVVMGRSLGGGPAMALTRSRLVAGVVLQSAFTSVGAMASRAYRLPSFLARDPFDNLEAVRAYEGPLLVMHGEWDGIIPFGHGVALAEASRRSTLVPLQCGHNDCPPSWTDYWAAVGSFLQREGLLPEAGDRR